MIHQLYSGAVSPCSNRFSASSAYSVAMEKLVQAETQLLEALTEQQRGLLTNLTDLYAKLMDIQCSLAYQEGFCMAAELSLDILQHRTSKQ